MPSAFFHNATNVTIAAPVTFNFIQGNLTLYCDKGLGILQQHVALSALYSSDKRSGAPSCDAGTLQEEILEWLGDSNDTHSAMWLNGEPGTSKSPIDIAQTIAQLCSKRGQLSSSFFLARNHPDRNNETKLVSTLAYQMSLQIPETRMHISAAILRNPRIFEASIQAQLDALIIFPLSSVRVNADATSKPKLIVIDGLDQCKSLSAQYEIVKAFVSSLSTKKDKLKIRHKILIVSRPEIYIQAAFDDPYVSSSTKRLSHDEKWLLREDDDWVMGSP